MRQTFICIGAQKAGTTTLADILSFHADICIPPIKETKYFLFDADYAKGKAFYDAYFTNYSGQQAVGEVDPDYLLFPFTAQRIKETLGEEIKIFVVLRNPADRAYSHYLMTKRKGMEPFGFEEALAAEAGRKQDIKTRKIFAYVERGYYGKQLETFLSIFKRENFLFLEFEKDFMQNKAATIQRIEAFLGVAHRELPLDLHSNEAGEAKHAAFRDMVRKPNFVKRMLKAILPVASFRKYIRKFFIRKNMQKASVPKLDAGTRQAVISRYFLDDIRLAEKQTGLNLSHWYTEV